MKPLHTHLVLGGVIKTYSEAKSKKSARFAINLIAESNNESTAVLKLANDLKTMAAAVEELALGIQQEAQSARPYNIEDLRKDYLSKIAAQHSDSEFELGDPYSHEDERY